MVKTHKTLLLLAFFPLANSSNKRNPLTPDRLPSSVARKFGSTFDSGQAHIFFSSGSSFPSSASTTLSPITGKNLKA